MENCIDQVVVAIAQIAAILTQANGMPIPPAMQELGVEIQDLEVSRYNKHPARNG